MCLSEAVAAPAAGAADDLNLDLARSFMVGDKPSDVSAGRAAGCRTVLVAAADDGAAAADFVAPDWAAIVHFLMGRERESVGGQS